MVSKSQLIGSKNVHNLITNLIINVNALLHHKDRFLPHIFPSPHLMLLSVSLPYVTYWTERIELLTGPEPTPASTPEPARINKKNEIVIDPYPSPYPSPKCTTPSTTLTAGIF